MSMQPSPQFAPVPVEPVLAPSPMSIGDLVSTATRALKRCFGLMLGITLAQIAAVVGVVVLGALAVAGVVFSQPENANGDPDVGFGAALAAIVVGLVLFALMFAVSVKFAAMQVATVDQMARGLQPSFASTSAQTKGVVRRTVPLIGLGVLAWLVVGGLFGVVMFTSMGSGDDPSTGAVLAMVLLGLVLLVGGIYLWVRWAFTNQALAVEGLGGIASLRRSWGLTKGRFWPVLGAILFCQVVPAILVSMLQAPMQNSTSNSDSPSALAVVLSIVAAVLQFVIALWQSAFLTILYIDHVQRQAVAGNTPGGHAPWQASTSHDAPWQGVAPGAGQDLWTPGAPQGVAPQPVQPPAAPQQPTPPQQPGGEDFWQRPDDAPRA